MTHREMLEMPRPPSIDPSDCDGQLTRIGSHIDRIMKHGGIHETACIDVFRCDVCKARISLREGVVLNAYWLPLLGAESCDAS